MSGESRPASAARRLLIGGGRWIVGCVLAGGVALVARAEGAVDLADYVRQVVIANPLVLEQLHVYRQVAQDERIALGGWRPRLDLSASAGKFSRKAPNTSQQRTTFDSQQADVTLTQNLFDGFNTTNQVALSFQKLLATPTST